MRFLEFFAASIRSPHTRRAYAKAARDFLSLCHGHGVRNPADIAPIHVAAWIETLNQSLAASSVKQRLAAIRHLFDWLVTGQAITTNPAASVRGLRTARGPGERRCWRRRKRGPCWVRSIYRRGPGYATVRSSA